jgi:hypothetical protein
MNSKEAHVKEIIEVIYNDDFDINELAKKLDCLAMEDWRMPKRKYKDVKSLK